MSRRKKAPVKAPRIKVVKMQRFCVECSRPLVACRCGKPDEPCVGCKDKK